MSDFLPINAADLMNKRLNPIRFCVEDFLPTGLALLAGEPKLGKSFFALDLSLHVANGEPFFENNVNPSSVLYYALEDPERRLKDRLDGFCEEAPKNLYLPTSAPTIAQGLTTQISDYVAKDPSIKLVIIDTLQKIRDPHHVVDMSYSRDYAELQILKKLADSLDICILLIHHTRKGKDENPFHRILGTQGIMGTADTIFVLEHDSKHLNQAILHATGRDIESFDMKLKRNSENGAWDFVSNSNTAPKDFLAEPLIALVDHMSKVMTYKGDNTTLCEAINKQLKNPITPRRMKQLMNRNEDRLRTLGLTYESYPSNGKRYVSVTYAPIQTCAPCDTLEPIVTCDTNVTDDTTDTMDIIDMSDIPF